MIDKEKLKRRFSRNAKNYDEYANVQKKMGSFLVDNLVKHTIIECSQIKKILEIGCGTGYVTRKLANDYPNAQITAVDIAPGMIELVKSTIQNNNIDFICADIEEIYIVDNYDLIVSNATFQWLNDFEKTVARLIGILNENGILCFSTFGQHTFQELHEAFDKAKNILEIEGAVSPGQVFYSLNDLEQIIYSLMGQNNQNGLNIHSFESYEREYFDRCIDFLNTVKKIGANKSQRGKNTSNPGFIEKVIEIYDNDYSADNKVVATYHNLYFYLVNNRFNAIG
ncbi:malonyl-CoA O-methyltransferase [Peptoclostridium litorale DSM 5388]|uniref:Malonyl-[acyl-carrier protein] O-methyltransferase n=1 Tax=Peptoclostridium litorale DSM 5388 TaxID=1121324 RepID=A0A069RHZ8_PEPLI|nr:malonyl-ACP O-methyltransferase BioC [Peptoclostridium litorale]KDR96634.1 malonyl-[acyl-carrier protein] O-methyltransferase BioC [Peptoclostridium litorale DSM 5388]SIN68237.1 malonyl-CoA O-methyltransferase [Peptoclostridium litorale DSM 5388]